jgi:hypothetical protein
MSAACLSQPTDILSCLLSENLSLSVPDLLKTVKQFVQPDKHGQLDHMLQRYLCKELGKQQVRAAS